MYGKHFQGGLIFYIDENDGTGLVVTDKDLSSGTEWGCMGKSVLGANNVGIGAGKSNSKKIEESACGDKESAINICLNLSLKGFDDWF